MLNFPPFIEPIHWCNRGDQKYTQIIRNLTSHYKNHNKFSTKAGRILESGQRLYKYYLYPEEQNEFAKKQIENLIDDINDYEDEIQVNEADYYNSEEETDVASNRNPVLKPGNNVNHRYQTDPKLAKTILQLADYKCELKEILPLENHATFETSGNHVYLEAHHLIPIKAQKDFPNQNLDRVENIVALCPICHRAVHYGTREEKIKHLKPLYDARINSLRDCVHHIDISFEDLVNRYY
ncbi:MAG: HNH endonuclease [Bacilli bacterium]